MGARVFRNAAPPHLSYPPLHLLDNNQLFAFDKEADGQREGG
jgi:hypothetical protein